jgi:hypothetical protein
MIDYRTPPLGYLVRVPQESLDSSLDASARARAEDAARFLSFERIGGVASSGLPASVETAEIVLNGCMEGGFVQGLREREDAEVICGYLLNTREPFVLVLRDREIRAAVERLTGANVCGEIVAPGGIISVHRVSEIPSGSEGSLSQSRVIARHMILDFSFTDFVQSVTETDQPLSQQGSLAPLRD